MALVRVMGGRAALRACGAAAQSLKVVSARAAMACLARQFAAQGWCDVEHQQPSDPEEQRVGEEPAPDRQQRQRSRVGDRPCPRRAPAGLESDAARCDVLTLEGKRAIFPPGITMEERGARPAGRAYRACIGGVLCGPSRAAVKPGKCDMASPRGDDRLGGGTCTNFRVPAARGRLDDDPASPAKDACPKLADAFSGRRIAQSRTKAGVPAPVRGGRPENERNGERCQQP